MEFLEDAYQEDPVLAMDVRKKYLGTELSPTGDPLIDMWERQIAAGEVPDLDACESPEVKEKDRMVQEAARRHYEETGERFYIPPRPDMTIEQIERMRESTFPEGLDIDKYHESRDFLKDLYSPKMNRYQLEEALRDIPPSAFDEFVNSVGLLKK